MNQTESLRQQSIVLLKQQTNRLKVQNKEIEVRDQQIHFLKETIFALEQEKDQALHQNHQLKVKLKTMATQITQYNANVVQKIYEENQGLIKEIQELKNHNQEVSQQWNDNSKKLRQLQNKLQNQSHEKVQLNTAHESLKETKTKQEKKVTFLQKENKQLQSKNISLQRQLDESSSQINYCSQQIDILTQKHHDALKNSDKKLKQLAQKMVLRQQYQKIQKQLKESQLKNKQLRNMIQKTSKQNDKIKFEAISLKDKLLTLQIKQQTKSQIYKLDIINLLQSIKLNKKIAEFQSQEHQGLDSIYAFYRDLQEKVKAYEMNEQKAKFQVSQMQLKVSHMGQQIKQYETELILIKEQHEEDLLMLETEYENKLMEISYKLKKEEIALINIKHKESQLQSIKDSIEKENELFMEEKNVLLRTNEELTKENRKLGEEINGLVKLCEDNFMGKQAITYYKYVIQDLIAIIFYLHLLLLRQKERSNKIYLPFIKYFLAIHPSLEHSSPRKPKALYKFRIAVHMIVAIQRMKNSNVQGNSLQRHSNMAVQTRYKVANLSNHIQNLSTIILNGGKINDLLKSSQQIYKWKSPSYLKIRLPINEDRKQLIKPSELQFDEQQN